MHQLAGDVYNWDGGFCSLIPMRTLADHNCLCHSAAITAWGLQACPPTTLPNPLPSQPLPSFWTPVCWVFREPELVFCGGGGTWGQQVPVC